MRKKCIVQGCLAHQNSLHVNRSFLKKILTRDQILRPAPNYFTASKAGPKAPTLNGHLNTLFF